MKHKVGILISGRGSNMMSLVEASRAENSPYEIALVASDKPDAPGLAWARDNGVAGFTRPKPASDIRRDLTFADGPQYWYSATDQVIVTKNRKFLDWARIDEVSEEIEDRADLPTFTDAHHNLLRILK